jgi:hypothetical protein
MLLQEASGIGKWVPVEELVDAEVLDRALLLLVGAFRGCGSRTFRAARRRP